MNDAYGLAGDFFHRVLTLYFAQQTGLCVVFDEWFGLSVKGFQPGPNSGGVVIITLDERAAAEVADSRFGGWFELKVIRRLAVTTDPPAGEPLNYGLIRDGDVDDAGEMATEAVQDIGQGQRLRQSAREAIQHETGSGIRPGKAFTHHRIGHFIRDEFATVHVVSGETAEVSVVPQIFPEEVAGGDVGEIEFPAERFCLSAFAGAGTAEQHQI